MALRGVRRAVLACARTGGLACDSVQSGVRLYASQSAVDYSRANVSDESEDTGSRQAREGLSSVFAHSIGRDIAALEAIREAYAPGSALDAAFGLCANRLAQCARENRRIYVTGMGKSAIVARRLASSLTSVAISSQWVHGGEWIHGELGGLRNGDVVIILSHSGNTSELVSLPKRFQDAGCCVVSVVGEAKSQLASSSDFVLLVAAQDESRCPVPSRSIVAQEAVCNALIECLIKGMSGASTKLRQSHPGGAIGHFYREIDP